MKLKMADYKKEEEKSVEEIINAEEQKKQARANFIAKIIFYVKMLLITLFGAGAIYYIFENKELIFSYLDKILDYFL